MKIKYQFYDCGYQKNINKEMAHKSVHKFMKEHPKFAEYYEWTFDYWPSQNSGIRDECIYSFKSKASLNEYDI